MASLLLSVSKRLALAAGAVLAVAGFAVAQEAGVRLELNKLEPQGENCRVYLLVDNAKGDALGSLKLDLFALDTDGVAAKRVAVEVGPVPEKKTQIKLFDFAGLGCPRIGQVLLNDVIACEGASGPREGCLASVEAASKVDAVAFVK